MLFVGINDPDILGSKAKLAGISYDYLARALISINYLARALISINYSLIQVAIMSIEGNYT
jgi:hypothetical protein